MKSKLIKLMALLLLAAGCSSADTDSNNGNGGQGSALLKTSTGWTRTATIPFSASVTGFEGSHAITPYDLTTVGNELALVYSEDYKLTGMQGHKVFKVKFAPNAGTVTGAVPLQRGGYGFCHSTRFIPECFTTISMKIDNVGGTYVCGVYDDELGLIGGNNLGYQFPIAPVNWYPDGGLTLSQKWSSANGNISDALSYKYPDTGNFTITENQWSLDTTRWIQTSALRLSGGEINQFIVSYQGSKLYFSIIKDDPSYVPTNGVQHNFFMQVRQEMTGLDATKFISGNTIIASNVVNDKYTVLLGEVTNGGNPVITKVHCYQWQKGATQFTKLYGGVTVPEDVGTNLMFKTIIGSRPEIGKGAPVKFTPDGTAYMLYNYSPSNYVQNDEYTALATINATGAKVSGKYNAAEYDSYDQIGLGVCHYYNGAYYAVVFQRSEDVYSINDSEFRMEIVKIQP